MNNLNSLSQKPKLGVEDIIDFLSEHTSTDLENWTLVDAVKDEKNSGEHSEYYFYNASDKLEANIALNPDKSYHYEINGFYLH